MAKKIKVTRKTVLYWTVLNLGILLLSIGIYFFKGPRNFATGGVSGLSIVLAKFVPDSVSSWLNQTNIMSAINILLLVIGIIFLGVKSTMKTTYCVLVNIAEMKLLELLPINLPLTSDIFLDFVFAMLLTSVGSAILFNCGASSGGTDIIALIIKKYTNVKNVGMALVLTDCLIAASSFFVFDLRTGLFSMLGLISKSVLVDGVVESIGKNKYITIITSAPEKIEPFILEGIHRGYTSFKATGGYTEDEKTIILTVCKRGEALKLKLKIHKEDPSSFVIITDTKEIIGKGFGGM